MKFITSLILYFLIGLATLHANNHHKVVFDLTSGQDIIVEKALFNIIKNIKSYYKQKDIDVAVVISGDSYKYFIKDIKNSPYSDDSDIIALQPKLEPKLQELNDKFKVKFYMCSYGMTSRDIPEESLYNFVKAEKTKSIYLIELQNDGYAYIPIH